MMLQELGPWVSARGPASGALLNPDTDPCPRALGREAGSTASCRHGAGLSPKDAGGYTDLESDFMATPASLTGRLET